MPCGHAAVYRPAAMYLMDQLSTATKKHNNEGAGGVDRFPLAEFRFEKHPAESINSGRRNNMFILATPRANMPWACDDMSPFHQSFVAPRRGQIVHGNDAGAKGPVEYINSGRRTSSFRPAVAATSDTIGKRPRIAHHPLLPARRRN